MYLTRHLCADGPRWAMDHRLLPADITLAVLLQHRQPSLAAFLRARPGGDGVRRLDPEESARLLAERSAHAGLRRRAGLPDDTRLWAALQQASGGTWGGCVYDVDRIVAILEAGMAQSDGAARPTDPR